jgi:uncharacterized membrane protein YccC
LITAPGTTAPRRILPRRGTSRVPGADLHRLPIRIDLAGISLLEGLRTTVAAGVSLFADTWMPSDLLLVFGVAALVVCFSDTGGPTRQRIKPLLVLTVLGGFAWAVFGILRGLGLPYVLPIAALCIFANSMARVWGLPGQAVGNVLTVIIVLALDAPLDWHAALVIDGVFVAGGLWSVLLTVLILGFRPNRPAALAVNDVWALLADLAADLLALLRADAGGLATAPEDWAAHARVHRRAVRDAIERARVAVAATMRVRGPSSPQSMANLLRLDTAERLFGGLIALSDLTEHTSDEALRRSARRLLRRLHTLLKRFGEMTPAGDQARIGRAIDRLAGDQDSPPVVSHLAGSVAIWMRAALRQKYESEVSDVTLAESLPAPAEGSLWEALRSNLTWNSAILRHAVRVTVVTVPAIAVALIYWTPYSHWLAFSVALTMQPFFSATWQRVLERIGGTVVGAVLGGALAFLPPTPLVHASLLLPLCILGFSARQVSYGAFIACLTPLVVLLFDIAEPGHSEWMIAGMRTAYTVAGGVMALIASLTLWPSWEPQRVRAELRAAVLAHASFARIVLADLAETGKREASDQARRTAGVAINNLEASLSRALQEPLRGRRAAVRRALLADAALRRLGACLITLEQAPRPVGPDRDAWRQWAVWLPDALVSAAQQAAPPAPALPGGDPVWRDSAERIQRHVDILGDAAGALKQAV